MEHQFSLNGVSDFSFTPVRYETRWFGWERPVVSGPIAEELLGGLLDGEIRDDGVLVLGGPGWSYSIEPDSDGLYVLPGEMNWVKETPDLDYVNRVGKIEGTHFTSEDAGLDFEVPSGAYLRELLYERGWRLVVSDDVLTSHMEVLLLPLP